MDNLEQLIEEINGVEKNSLIESIIISIMIAILGSIMIVHPKGTIKVVSIIFGAIIMIKGVLQVFDYIKYRKENEIPLQYLLFGGINIVIGAIILKHTFHFVNYFCILVGIMIICSALSNLNYAFRLKKINSKVWNYTLIISVFMLLFGILSLITYTKLISLNVGIIILSCSILDIIESTIYLHSIKQ